MKAMGNDICRLLLSLWLLLLLPALVLTSDQATCGQPSDDSSRRASFPKGGWFDKVPSAPGLENHGEPFRTSTRLESSFQPTSGWWSYQAPVNNNSADPEALSTDGELLHRRRRRANTEHCSEHKDHDSAVYNLTCLHEASRDDLEDPALPTFFPVPRAPGDYDMCMVHKCNATTDHLRSDDPASPMFGHLLPLGEQGQPEDPVPVAGCLDAETFVRDYVLKFRPVLMRGCNVSRFYQEGKEVEWDDEHFSKHLEDTFHWPDQQTWSNPIVEMQLNITTNERGPFMHEKEDVSKPYSALDRFLKRYKEEPLYFINQIPSRFQHEMPVPPPMRCRLFFANDAYGLVWWNHGKSASSQHFDTHDQMFLQLDGDKLVVLASPEYSREMYVDHHNKFGLSPINVRRVDLKRYPEVRNARIMKVHMTKGDMLYVPTHWWHTNFNKGGRNIMMNHGLDPIFEVREFEVEPWSGIGGGLVDWAEHRVDAPEVSAETVSRLCPGQSFWNEVAGGRAPTMGDLQRVRPESHAVPGILSHINSQGEYFYNGYSEVLVNSSQDWFETWLGALVSLIPGRDTVLGRTFRFVWGHYSWCFVFFKEKIGYLLDVRREPLQLLRLNKTACKQVRKAHKENDPNAPEYTAVFKALENFWQMMTVSGGERQDVVGDLTGESLFFYSNDMDDPEKRGYFPDSWVNKPDVMFDALTYSILKTVAHYQRDHPEMRPAGIWQPGPILEDWLHGEMREEEKV